MIRTNPRAHVKRGISIPHFDDVIKPLVRVKPPYTYVHYTNIDKVGINYKSEHGTPWGVYAYPLTPLIYMQMVEKKLPYMQSATYVFLLDSVPSSNILYTRHDISGEEFWNYMAELEMATGRDQRDLNALLAGAKAARYRQNSAEWAYNNISLLWDITQDIAKLSRTRRIPWPSSAPAPPGPWAKLFVDIGVDAIVDDGTKAVIHSNEPTQAVFFTPNSYRIRDMYDNPAKASQARQSIADLDAVWFDDEFLRQTEINDQQFQNISIRGRKLFDWLLKGVSFYNVDMRRTGLQGTTFKFCNFLKVDARGADFSSARIGPDGREHLGFTEIDHCTVEKCNFTGALFRETGISDTDFEDTEDFTRADFTDAYLFNNDFAGGIFRDAIFHNAKIIDTYLFDENIRVFKTNTHSYRKMLQSPYWVRIEPDADGWWLGGVRKAYRSQAAFVPVLEDPRLTDARRFAGADFRGVDWTPQRHTSAKWAKRVVRTQKRLEAAGALL